MAIPQAFYNPAVELLTVEAVRLGSGWGSYNFSAPYWRLYWNAAPGAWVVWKSHKTALGPGRFVIIPPDTALKAHCGGSPLHLYTHFIAGAPFDSTFPGVYEMPARGTLREMADRLARSVRPDRASALAALALVHAALASIPESAIRPAPSDPRIVRILQAMDANIQQPLSNAQLAAIGQLSTNSLLRLFREQTGSTPQAIYMRKRIDHSCMQLHFTDLKLDRVAELAGFCDRYHFSRTFKRLRGIGPAAFRRQSAR